MEACNVQARYFNRDSAEKGGIHVKRSRFIVLILALTVLAGYTVAGCGSKQNETTPDTSNASRKQDR